MYELIDLFQELNIELRKDISTMINKQERRLIIKLSHLYNHREGADLARRFYILRFFFFWPFNSTFFLCIFNFMLHVFVAVNWILCAV